MSTTARLEGKVAIVTGGASGNGRAIAQRFAAEGARIAIGDLDQAGMDASARLVQTPDRDVLVQHCDVTRRAEVQALVAATVERFGRLDVLVANAGIGRGDAFLDLSDDDWDAVLAVNLTGVFLCDQIAGRQMVAQGQGGAIINIASIMAVLGSAHSANYCASKAGVRSLTQSAALALAPHQIRVNAIGPGFIDTPMTGGLRSEEAILSGLIAQTPLRRLGEPGDVAATALFLASDDAKFMTGAILYNDGGFLLNSVQPSAEARAARRRLRERRGAGPEPAEGRR